MMLVRGFWLSAAMAVAIAAVLPAAGEELPQRGGTLTFGMSEPDSLDCHATLVAGAFGRILPHYSTLLKFDGDAYPRIVGDAAQSWTVSADGLAYSFTLRPDIVFHDGTPFTSADVKASYERLRHPQGGAVSIRQSHFADIESITTPDARTVIFKLAQVNAAMPVIFASPYNCLYSAARLAEDPKYPEKHIMGTGPFTFVSYTPGGDWISARFNRYFIPTKPYLDGIIVHTIARAAKATAIGGGQVMIDFDGLTPGQRDAALALRQGQSHAVEGPSTGALVLGFNTRRKPFDDVRVRRALTLAIDRWAGSKILAPQMEFAQVGAFQRAGSPFGLSLAELATKPGFTHDIEAARAEARRLLAEAGQSNLTLTYLNRAQSIPLGVFLIDQWHRIGVSVDHQVPEAPAYTRRRQTGDFDVTTGGLSDIVDDPTIQLSMVTSRSRNDANFAFYDDAKMDALFERQAHAANDDDRLTAYRALEDYLFEQSYYAMLFWGTRIAIVANEVQNYKLTPAQGVNLRLEEVWLKR